MRRSLPKTLFYSFLDSRLMGLLTYLKMVKREQSVGRLPAYVHHGVFLFGRSSFAAVFFFFYDCARGMDVVASFMPFLLVCFSLLSVSLDQTQQREILGDRYLPCWMYCFKPQSLTDWVMLIWSNLLKENFTFLLVFSYIWKSSVKRCLLEG